MLPVGVMPSTRVRDATSIPITRHLSCNVKKAEPNGLEISRFVKNEPSPQIDENISMIMQIDARLASLRSNRQLND